MTPLHMDNFSVTNEEWMTCLKTAFPAGLVDPKRHGFLYRAGEKILVSPSPQPSNLNIDKIVQVSRCFLENKLFSLENLEDLKKCYTIMQTSAARPKWFWSRFFEKCVHFCRGEHFISTNVLLNQELLRLDIATELFLRNKFQKQLEEDLQNAPIETSLNLTTTRQEWRQVVQQWGQILEMCKNLHKEKIFEYEYEKKLKECTSIKKLIKLKKSLLNDAEKFNFLSLFVHVRKAIIDLSAIAEV